MEQRLRGSAFVIESPWLQVVIVWVVALAVSGSLWQRFTRVPVQSSGFSRAPATPRRVVPLWLAVVWLILLSTAIWLTIRLARPG
jgi:hypothetical protein